MDGRWVSVGAAGPTAAARPRLTLPRNEWHVPTCWCHPVVVACSPAAALRWSLRVECVVAEGCGGTALGVWSRNKAPKKNCAQATPPAIYSTSNCAAIATAAQAPNTLTTTHSAEKEAEPDSHIAHTSDSDDPRAQRGQAVHTHPATVDLSQ